MKWFTLADGEEAVGKARWDFGMVVIPKDLNLSGELVQGLRICVVVVHRVAKYSFIACWVTGNKSIEIWGCGVGDSILNDRLGVSICGS